MPHLILFAPCEKAILDKSDNTMSLIGIMHGMTFHPTEANSESIPANAIAPLNWGAGSIWLRTPDDEEKIFEQKVEIVAPNGVRFFGDATTEFTMTHRTHHIAINGQGFPVGIPGEYMVALSLREVGMEEWHTVIEYPIQIRHPQAQEATNEQAQPQAE